MSSWARAAKLGLGVLVVAGVLVLIGGVRVTVVAPARPMPLAAPAPFALDVVELRVAEIIAALSLEQQIAQLMMVHCPSTDSASVSECLSASGASGVILMGDNIGPDSNSVAALTAALPKPNGVAALVAIDEEGGDVTRLPWDTLPGGSALAAAPVAETTAAFSGRAALLTEIGVNVNFGIVADVTDDPNSFLYDRVLGHTVDASAERVFAAVQAESSGAASGSSRLASTLKHFPGHGAASGNSHQVIPVDESTIDVWRASAALPFAAGVRAGSQLVMMSHVSYPNIDPAPASLSARWHRVLRDELHFDGVIVTDDLLMLRANELPEFADAATNAMRALQAGSDLLLWVLPADPASVGVDLPAITRQLADAVRSGQLDEQRVHESFERVLRLRLALSE
ncbi:MAG: glycoside hydrolase family 3 N-terminal domain-containing protein [Microbacteriaceae bacterium]